MDNISITGFKNEPKVFEPEEANDNKAASLTACSLVREKFLVWVDPVTIHGLPNIFRTKNGTSKIIWIVSTLAATVLCAYLLAQSIIDYLSFQVVTKIDLIEETSAIVPQITICSSHLFVTNSSSGNALFYSVSLF